MDTLKNMTHQMNEVDKATSDLKNNNLRLKDSINEVIEPQLCFINVSVRQGRGGEKQFSLNTYIICCISWCWI